MNNEQKAPDVPFIVYEADKARQERTVKRMLLLCGALTAALVISTVSFLRRC